VGDLVTTTIATSEGTIGALDQRHSNTWTAIAYPSAGSTAAYGPAIAAHGYRIVGSYKAAGSKQNHAFVYDSATGRYETIDPPTSFCAPYVCTEAVAHSNVGLTAFQVVGNCDAPGSGPGGLLPHAFLYASTTAGFRKIDVAGALGTTAYGIWRDPGEVAVAGGYTDAHGTHGYVRGLVSGRLVTYDAPGALITHFEGITGAGGAGNYNLAGDWTARGGGVNGFWLPIRGWKAGTPIALGAVSANSVYRRTIVGVMPARPPAGYLVTVPGI
jgi:hypothetical protein